MTKKSPQVDAYVAKAPAFARPILKRIRRLFHQACPEIEETMKWSVPHFDYQGMVGAMAAFKAHVRLGFWKGTLMKDPQKLFTAMGKTSMGALRLESLDDLPPDKVMVAYIKEAVTLNERGVKVARSKPAAKKELQVPDDFMAALKKNKKALTTFAGFSPRYQREYVYWITGAKQEATRHERIATALEWLAQGKSRFWKYQK